MAELHDLTDPAIVRELFQMAADEVLYRLQRVASHAMKSEQAKAMDDAMARHLARALMGENPQFRGDPAWNGMPCAQALKAVAGSYYDEVLASESNPDETNPREVMVLSLSAFHQAVYVAIEDAAARADCTAQTLKDAVGEVAQRYALAAMPAQSGR